MTGLTPAGFIATRQSDFLKIIRDDLHIIIQKLLRVYERFDFPDTSGFPQIYF